MMQRSGSKHCLLLTLFFAGTFFAATAVLSAQSNYNVVTVSNGGTISGTVRWSGPLPLGAGFPGH